MKRLLPEETVGGRHRRADEFKAHRANVKRMDRRADVRATDQGGGQPLSEFERMSAQQTPTRNRRSNASRSVLRVVGDSDFPDRAASERRDPKPPAILVLYPDLQPRLRPKAVYGQYPRGFIARMLPWLGCERREVLHLCSGCLPPGEGIRVDIRPEAQPDIVADVTRLPLRDNSVAAVMCDPPYSPAYAKNLYGVKYPRPSHVLREAARVVRPGGMIVFVHYITPRPPRGTDFVRAWALSTGFDMPVRAVTLYRKHGGPTLALAAPTEEGLCP